MRTDRKPVKRRPEKHPSLDRLEESQHLRRIMARARINRSYVSNDQGNYRPRLVITPTPAIAGVRA